MRPSLDLALVIKCEEMQKGGAGGDGATGTTGDVKKDETGNILAAA